MAHCDPVSWLSTLITTLMMLTTTQGNLVFSLLFLFRYVRLIVNTIAFYFIYTPTPIPAEPTIYPRDCTVIIPTVDPENAGFLECIHTVLQNQPGAVLIVTVGKAKVKLVKQVVKPFRKSWPSTTISVTSIDVANKRLQVCHAIPQVNTALTVLVDDHVYWPSINFLNTICAPFEDRKVGGLGTNKVVRRTGSGYSMSSIFNFWGCAYLERHNFELAATNALDGSVFVLSGRTSVHRTQILKDPEFLRGFANEMFFFGKFGPIAADDDNFITRWEVKHGWDIKFQHCDDARIETDLGAPDKFLSQCMRWARTTWRSNSCSLFTDRTVWHRQPWGVYAIYISSFFNFALFCDSALIYALLKTTFGHSWKARLIMVAWIFASKMIKLIPHFRRHPADLMLIPAYLAFAYFHSLMKLWALFTFFNVAWSGRNLAAVDADAQVGASFDDSGDDDDEDDSGDADRESTRSSPSYCHGHSTSSSFSSSHDTARSRSSRSSSPYGSSGTWTATASRLGDNVASKSVLYDRFFAVDDAHSPSLASPASSSGSSTQSASYGTSQWSMWEKASNQSKATFQSCAPSFCPPNHSSKPWGTIDPTDAALQGHTPWRTNPIGIPTAQKQRANLSLLSRPSGIKVGPQTRGSHPPAARQTRSQVPIPEARAANLPEWYTHRANHSSSSSTRSSSSSSRSSSSSSRSHIRPSTKYRSPYLEDEDCDIPAPSTSETPDVEMTNAEPYDADISSSSSAASTASRTWSSNTSSASSSTRSTRSRRSSSSSSSSSASARDTTKIPFKKPTLAAAAAAGPEFGFKVYANRATKEPTKTKPKRPRGVDCGRQHVNAVQLRPGGKCALPQHIWEIGLS